MSTATESALQAKTITPSLTVDDLKASIGFFESLGFAVEERWEDKGKLNGVMLLAGNARIGLSQDDWKKGRDRKKGRGHADLHRNRAGYRQAGGSRQAVRSQVESRPARHGVGDRAFEVTEPSGFLLTIGSME